MAAKMIAGRYLVRLSRALSSLWREGTSQGVRLRLQRCSGDRFMGTGGAFSPRKRAEATVDELLQAFGRTATQGYTIGAGGTVQDAIEAIVTRRIPTAIAVENDSFVGVVTARDVLRALYEARDDANPLKLPLRDFVTPADQVVTAAPEDTLSHVSVMMSEARVRSMPVVRSRSGITEVVGMVLHKDVSDFINTPETGDKASFSKNILARRGLGTGATTKLHARAPEGGDSTPPASARASADPGRSSGSFMPAPLPARPSGTWLQLRTGAACEARQVKPPQPRPLIEDSHFVARISWPADAVTGSGAQAVTGHSTGAAEGGGALAPLTYIGVFDGVGSWVGRGVDPTAFSAALRDASVQAVELAPQGHFGPMGRGATSIGGLGAGAGTVSPPTPLEVMTAAWLQTTSSRVIGSATALLASLDPITGQLAVANVGDCGVLVVRPGTSGTVGSLVSGASPLRGSADDVALAVAYRSAQQLKDFNYPFQLGFAPKEGSVDSEGVFEEPVQADFTRVPVISGDIVIAASDG